MSLDGRSIRVWASGRFHKWNKFVYDGFAIDHATGIKVVSKHWKSQNGAKEHAREELLNKLKEAGVFQKAKEEAERLAALERKMQEMEAERKKTEARNARQQQINDLTNQRNVAQVQLESIEARLPLLRSELNRANEVLAGFAKKRSAVLFQIETEQKQCARFAVERKEENMKIIVLLGYTGDGKSTLGNRLLGDVSNRGNEGLFETSAQSASCTQNVIKQVSQALGVCVVDTPGFGDTNGMQKDREHANTVCSYLRGCGGINGFVLCRNGSNIRYDQAFQGMLSRYYEMFGNPFFEHLTIVATKIDYSSELFHADGIAAQMRSEIKNQFNLSDSLINSIAVVPMGYMNFTQPVQQVLQSIATQKFECNDIRSPLDDLEQQKQALDTQVHTATQALAQATQAVQDAQAEQTRLESQKTSLQQQIQALPPIN